MQLYDRNYFIYKLLEDLAKQKLQEGVISYYDADEFGRIALAMFPHEVYIHETDICEKETDTPLVAVDTNNECHQYTSFKDIKDSITKLEDLLDPEQIQTGDLAIKKSDIMPQEVPDNLPSSEDYQKRSEEYANEHFKINMMQYSGPHYRCPMCQEGGMCRDETVSLLSYPPKHKYVCNKCNFVDYKNI